MNIKSSLIFLLIFSFFIQSFAQQKDSPYQTDFLKDGIGLTAGVGLTAVGVLIIQNKDDLTRTELASLSKDDIWAFDRWSAGYSSEKADDLSYIPFFGSFAMPLALLLNQNERSHAGQISVLYIQTMATTGALYTITAGLVQRSRPLVYDESIPIEDRLASKEQRSFFAGHTAATAAATFFVAKVFNDFNPDSPLRPYVWAFAAAVPAYVGYLRLKAGKHFLSDNIIGFAVGAASGILIPEIHKKENKNLQIYPTVGFHLRGMNFNSQGMGVRYTF